MAKKEEEKIFAFLCYLISIIGVVIVLATKKERSDFSIYHAKQGLVLFITEMILWVIAVIFTGIFFFVPFIGGFFWAIIWLLIVLLIVVGIVNSLTDKRKPLPVIGGFAKSFKF